MIDIAGGIVLAIIILICIYLVISVALVLLGLLAQVPELIRTALLPFKDPKDAADEEEARQFRWSNNYRQDGRTFLKICLLFLVFGLVFFMAKWLNV